MPTKTLKDDRLGGIRLRLVRRADATLAGRYARENGDSDIINAAPGETQDELWQRLRASALQGDPSFVGFDGAISRSRAIFAHGFRDAEYLEQERDYKVHARELPNSMVPLRDAAMAVVTCAPANTPRRPRPPCHARATGREPARACLPRTRPDHQRRAHAEVLAP